MNADSSTFALAIRVVQYRPTILDDQNNELQMIGACENNTLSRHNAKKEHEAINLRKQPKYINRRFKKKYAENTFSQL